MYVAKRCRQNQLPALATFSPPISSITGSLHVNKKLEARGECKAWGVKLLLFAIFPNQRSGERVCATF